MATLQIQRNGASEQSIGTSSDQKFEDLTLPAGVVNATYQVSATRGTKASQWSEGLSVRFNPETRMLISEFREAA